MLKSGQLLFTRDGRAQGNAIAVVLIEKSSISFEDRWLIEHSSGAQEVASEIEICNRWFTENMHGDEQFTKIERFRFENRNGFTGTATFDALRSHLEEIREALGVFYSLSENDEVAAIHFMRKIICVMRSDL